jgi:hypothetical protein
MSSYVPEATSPVSLQAFADGGSCLEGDAIELDELELKELEVDVQHRAYRTAMAKGIKVQFFFHEVLPGDQGIPKVWLYIILLLLLLAS